MMEFPADDGRLAELILHVSARCADWEGYDPALLERILFQADFLHHRLKGRPITGQAYRRGPSGPSPRGLGRVLRGLAREFAILEIPAGDGLHVSRRPAALREADLSRFSDSELEAVEAVLAHFREAWSPARREGPDYLEIPWREAGPREALPYSLARRAPEPAPRGIAPAPVEAGRA